MKDFFLFSFLIILAFCCAMESATVTLEGNTVTVGKKTFKIVNLIRSDNECMAHIRNSDGDDLLLYGDLYNLQTEVPQLPPNFISLDDSIAQEIEMKLDAARVKKLLWDAQPQRFANVLSVALTFYGGYHVLRHLCSLIGKYRKKKAVNIKKVKKA